MKIKFILPSLTEAEDSFWRPIKYSLFPPLGLATLASYVSDDDEAEIVDQHVEKLSLDDEPCLLYTSPSPRDKRQSRMPSSA